MIVSQIFKISLDSQFLADILGDGILVDHEVHGVVGHESLGHVPCAFVVAILTL